MAMEHFVLKDQHNNPNGLIPILEDDYDTALEKAKSRAKKKCNIMTDITIYHRTQDKYSETLTSVMTVKDKR